MRITINKKEYPLHIGLAFVRELDKKYTQNFAGVEFGHGIAKIFLALSQYNPVAYCDFILAATCTLDNPPTEEDIEKEIESWEETEVIEKYMAFLDALGESTLTKAQVAQIAITQLQIEAMAMRPEKKTRKKPIGS